MPNVAEAFVTLRPDTKGFGAEASRGISGALGGIAGAASKALLGVTAIGAVGFGAAIKQAANFEASLNLLQAVSSATGDEMQRMSSLAKQLGADTSLPATSAKDAADAMLELAKAGLSVTDTMGAARGVLQLSAAGNISNARAAEITANALNSFGLAGTEAVRIADLLAAAANASSVEVLDLADAFQMSSAVFAAAHIPIEDLTAAIGLLGNAGIKGSDSGTSLKQMILSLETPSVKAKKLMRDLGFAAYDAAGNMVDMRTIIERLQKSMGPLTQQQRDFALGTIFGSDAIRSANVLLAKGVEGFDSMKVAVTKQGAAADLAAARMKGLNGAIEAIKSSVQTVAISIGSLFLPVLASMARSVAQAVSAIDPLIALISLGFNGGRIGGEWSKVERAAFGFGEVLRTDVVPALKDIQKWLKDKVLPVARDFGNWIITKAIPGLLQFGKAAAPVVARFFENFTEGLTVVGPLVKDFFNFIINNKVALIIAIAAIGTALLIAMGPGAAIVVGIASLISLIGVLKRDFPGVARVIEDFARGLQREFELIGKVVGALAEGFRREFVIIGAIVETFLGVANRIGAVFGAIPDAVRAAFRGVIEYIVGEINDVIRSLNSVSDAIKRVSKGAIDLGNIGEIRLPGGPAPPPILGPFPLAGTTPGAVEGPVAPTDDVPGVPGGAIPGLLRSSALPDAFHTWGVILGEQAAAGILDGTESGIGDVEALLNPLKSPPGFHAMPALYNRFGKRLGQNLGEGIASGIKAPLQTISDLIASLPNVGDFGQARPFQTPQDVMTTMAVIDGIKRPLQTVEDWINTMAVAANIRPFQTVQDVIGTAATAQNAQQQPSSVNVTFQVAGNVEIPERDVIDAVQRYNNRRRTETLRAGASINYSMG